MCVRREGPPPFFPSSRLPTRGVPLSETVTGRAGVLFLFLFLTSPPLSPPSHPFPGRAAWAGPTPGTPPGRARRLGEVPGGGRGGAGGGAGGRPAAASVEERAERARSKEGRGAAAPQNLIFFSPRARARGEGERDPSPQSPRAPAMPTTWEAAAPAAPPCGDAYGAAGAAGAAAAGLVVEASGPSGSSSHSSAEVTLRLFAGLPRPDAHPQRVQVELEHVGNKVSGGGAGCGGGERRVSGAVAQSICLQRALNLGRAPPFFCHRARGRRPGAPPHQSCAAMGRDRGRPAFAGGWTGGGPSPPCVPP